MFLRLKVINGQPYLHAEKRWRENGVVKSKDWVLSAVFNRSQSTASIPSRQEDPHSKSDKPVRDQFS